MKTILPITLIIILFTGCSEMEEAEPVRIVSIDPPIQHFTHEEIEELEERVVLELYYPPAFVHVKPREYSTITVTFSAPPEDLRLDVWLDRPQAWSLDGNILTIDVWCYYYKRLPPSGSTYQYDFTRIPLEWKDGGMLLVVWCPIEEIE